jgi:hypothetical protein
VQYTSALPKGATKRIEWAVNGMDVWRTVTVYQDGKVLRKKTYYSHYATVTGIVQVGTGGASTKPKPTPKPTPAPTPAPTPTP